MNEKFTPGPWFVDHGVPGKPRVASESDVLKKMICACEHGAKSRQDYDAALIAAAPEMYDVIDRLVPWLEHDPNADSDEYLAFAKEMRRILKKARGES